MIALTLGACSIEEGRAPDAGPSRSIEEGGGTAAVAADIVEWLAGLYEPIEPFEFAIENIHLSADDYAELEANVGLEVDPEWFDDETGLRPVIEGFNAYDYPACEDGCSDAELEARHDEASALAQQALAVYQAHTAPEYGDRRILVSENIRLAMAIYLAMSTDVRRLRELRGIVDGELDVSDEALRGVVGDFIVLLAELEQGHESLESQFGSPKITLNEQLARVACFDSPTGPDCGDRNNQNLADMRLMLEAEGRRRARLAQAFARVIGEDFERIVLALNVLDGEDSQGIDLDGSEP
ncbi:MAG: hypothetical protein K0V04_43485 [Deltaproteobacteria bacterium]|nr:hypothetical protein [Deltaproteobacteria bacterium]